MILSGKELAADIKREMKEIVRQKRQNDEKIPSLAIVVAGHNQASAVYVQSAKRACEQAEIPCVVHSLAEEVTEQELLDLVCELNNNDTITGILVQLPLPVHVDPFRVIDAIDPGKDVDGFHPVNIGNLSLGRKAFIPSTPAGIMALLDFYKIDLCGKSCAIIGRSNIVGKPLAALMTHKNATVTVCHTRTKNLADITRQADIVAVAAGRVKTLTGDMLKPGAVVLDVGINRDEENKLCGDADFESCAGIASAITPVPGGVGAMTIAMLLRNCVYGMENIPPRN